MASSGVIGRHRAVGLSGGTTVVGRRPRRAWTRPLLALLAIAVLPLLGRSAVLLAGSLSPATLAAPASVPAATAPAQPPAAQSTDETAPPTTAAVPAAPASTAAAPRPRAV